MKSIGWIFILLLVTIGSCMASQSEMTKPIVFGDVPNPEEWAFGDKLAYLVVTDKNWKAYYSSPPQGSDFATCIYLVASLGVRPNPGYRIRILQIKQQNERITISLELVEPDPKKVYPQVIMRPLAVAEVTKGNLQPYSLFHFVFTDQKGREITTVKTGI